MNGIDGFPLETGQNDEKPRGLRRFSIKALAEGGKLDLDRLSLAELYALRDEIDVKLPPTNLRDLNMEQELVMQYHRTKALQEETNQADDVPTNQRAQVANTVANTLQRVVDMQGKVYNAEQFRKMEAALARALRTLPIEAQNVFFEAYEKTIEEMASAA